MMAECHGGCGRQDIPAGKHFCQSCVLHFATIRINDLMLYIKWFEEFYGNMRDIYADLDLKPHVELEAYRRLFEQADLGGEKRELGEEVYGEEVSR